MARILVADDEFDMAQMISEMLVLKGGYDVEVVYDGQDALSEAMQKEYDLFLLDVNMPKKSGYEVCETLKNNQQNSEIPVIFLTGLKDEESKIKGLQAGANDFLTKPVNIDELHLRVENMLKLHRYSKMLKNYNEELEAKVKSKTMK